MQGRISVDSWVGRGTSFFFTIQTRTSAVKVVQLDHALAIGELTGKKILIVDDNATNCYILKKHLESWHFETEAVQSAREAMDLLRQHHFDCMITDRYMPEQDGVQLAEMTRASWPGLPIVLLSAVGDEKNAAFDHLFGAILSKPVRLKDLQAAIVAQFSRAHMPGMQLESGESIHRSFADKHPLRILVAEDYEVNQVLIEMIMHKLGYMHHLVPNGKEAVEAVLKNHYDLVLMDMQMPEMDGLDATRAIRKANVRQPVIVALTANATKEDRELCLGSGMDDYISKPIQLEQLMLVLEKYARNLRVA
jgi:CheY-like chemotaxis protein